MTLGSAWHQKSGQPERTVAKVGETHFRPACDEAPTAGHQQEGSGRDDLLQQVLSRENMVAAWKRVKANKGSAGVDGLTIEQTAEHLKVRWPQVREEIMAGRIGLRLYAALKFQSQLAACGNWVFRRYRPADSTGPTANSSATD